MTVYLVDTNILVRLTNRHDPRHEAVRRATLTLQGDGHILCLTPQACIEFWNVATRPLARNGLGLTPVGAERQLKILERFLAPLPDTAAIYPLWRRLVVQFGVSGVQTHDARLVAVMQAHGITHLLTLNGADFARYAPLGIRVIDPTSPEASR